MSFISVSEIKTPKKPSPSASKFAISVAMHVGQRGPRMIVTIYGALARELGFKKGDGLDFLWGSGDDRGKALIKRSETGLSVQQQQGSVNIHLVVNKFPHDPPVNRTPHPTDDVTYKTQPDGSVMINLPTWLFKRNQTAEIRG
jgi:hypothetical protein